MLDEIRKQLAEYEVAAITEQNFEQIFEVYNTNQDFFLLTQGKEATIESSHSDMMAVPPHCDIQQKVYIGIWKDGQAVGVLDLITGYPERTCFWIGLLLVHGRLHGKKTGSRFVEAVLDAAWEAGYESAQLGVIESNTKAIKFWRKHGFDVLRHSGNIVVMARGAGHENSDIFRFPRRR